MNARARTASGTPRRSRAIEALRRVLRDRSGVAAVEFAFILPILLMLYVGIAGLTQAISAARGVTVLSRTLADLVSQQPANISLTDTVVQDIFNASTAVMSPFPIASLKMTLSNVEFVANTASTSSNLLDAKARWTVTFSSGTLRPCGQNSAATPVLTPISNTATPSSTTMPLGLYTAGFLIVADVTYVYTPTIGLLTWTMANGRSGSPSTLSYTMYRTSYMRPRQTDNIRYTSGQTALICTIASPQVQ